MENDGYDIIKIDDKDYVIIEKITLDNKTYFLLNELNAMTLTNNRFLMREHNGELFPLEDDEKALLQTYLLKKK